MEVLAPRTAQEIEKEFSQIGDLAEIDFRHKLMVLAGSHLPPSKWGYYSLVISQYLSAKGKAIST